MKRNEGVSLAGFYKYLNGNRKKAHSYLKKSIKKNFFDLDLLEYNERLKKLKHDKEFDFIFTKSKKNKK